MLATVAAPHDQVESGWNRLEKNSYELKNSSFFSNNHTSKVHTKAELDLTKISGAASSQQFESYKRSISDRGCREKQLDLIQIEIERNSPEFEILSKMADAFDRM